MSTSNYPRYWKRPPQIIHHPGWRWGLGIAAMVYLVLAVGSLEIDWQRVSIGLERGQRFVMGFLQPDFVSRQRDIISGLSESLTMTLTSTVVGILISIPIGRGA